MNVLIAGVAGFIGSYLTERLLGCRPQCTFREGVVQLLGWCQENQE